jgi:hypothetical protein
MRTSLVSLLLAVCFVLSVPAQDNEIVEPKKIDVHDWSDVFDKTLHKNVYREIFRGSSTNVTYGLFLLMGGDEQVAYECGFTVEQCNNLSDIIEAFENSMSHQVTEVLYVWSDEKGIGIPAELANGGKSAEADEEEDKWEFLNRAWKPGEPLSEEVLQEIQRRQERNRSRNFPRAETVP